MFSCARNVSVVATLQNSHCVVLLGFSSCPPAKCMYGPRNSAHVWPAGGERRRISFAAQTTFVCARPVDRTAETRYVNGETRYMNIQKPGSAVGVARTLLEVRNDNHKDMCRQTHPQNTRQNENSSCAMFPPVSGCSIPAITIELKVDVNSRNSSISRNIVPPRDTTECVGSALR